MRLIAHNIYQIVKHIIERKNPTLANIIINWDKIVGSEFKSKIYPIKISSAHTGKKQIHVLHIKVDNASLAVELSFQQEMIIERIAIYLGFKAIDRLHLVI